MVLALGGYQDLWGHMELGLFSKGGVTACGLGERFLGAK